MKLRNYILISLMVLFVLSIGFNSVSASDLNDLELADSSDLASVNSDIETVDSNDLCEIESSDSDLDSISDNTQENLLDGPSGNVDDNTQENLLDGPSGNVDDNIEEDNIDKDNIEEEMIYLSTNGNDENDGSKDNPVASIGKAIELAIYENNGPHRIFAFEGSYPVYGVDLDDNYLTIIGSGPDRTIFDGMEYTGGMFSIYNSNLTIKNLSIVSAVNTAASGGAFTNMGNLTIENLKVSDCTVKNANGGVIYSVGNLKIFNSSFTNNLAIPTDSGGNGGVIYVDGYYTSLPYPPSLNISGCEFIDNTAKGNSFGGGAIYMQYVDGFKSISNSKFINNKALAGGAIFLQNSEGDFLMNNVSFIRNKATGTVSIYGGGALNLIGKTDGRVGNIIITNSEFVNNSAVNTRGGGAILDRNVDLNISNSFIYNNKDNVLNLSIYKDTTVYFPSGGKIYLEDNWWGSNSKPNLDKISIQRWVVMDLSAEILNNPNINLENPEKSFEYSIDVLLNHYSDGSLIDSSDYYPFEREFSITSSNGQLNQSKGSLADNIATVSLSSPSMENLITLRIDNQSMEFNTNSIMNYLNNEDLQRVIGNVEEGAIIDLTNCRCENISNLNITKNLAIVGNNTIISSAGDGNPIFNIASDVASLSISGIEFIVSNGDVIVKATALNGTGLSILNPAIEFTNNTVSKANDDVVAESVTVLELDSERGVLATSNPITIAENAIPDGVELFDFEVTGVDSGSDVIIASGGNVPEKTETKFILANMTTFAYQSSIDGNIGDYFVTTLTDINGNPLANKIVKVGLNGKVYTRKTNATGGISVLMKTAISGRYTFAVSFLGDDEYNASFAVALCTVKKQTPKLSTSSKTYKASVKVKKLTATFKTKAGKALKGKTIKFTVNGKTYAARTNSKGVATVKVSIAKKGTYKFTAKYAGDSTYAAITKKATLKIK